MERTCDTVIAYDASSCRLTRRSIRQAKTAGMDASSIRFAKWGVVALAVCIAAGAQAADRPTGKLVARGAYLAAAGDCGACHTQKGGAPFAGGLAMDTPFGPLVSPNITPDKSTGIGNWTDDEFYRALHEGRARDGSFLYPAMPFPWYTKVTRDDALAIKAYLFSLAPVNKPRAPSHLRFPFNIRSALGAWREAFFKPGTFEPDPKASDEVNRGSYLVNGLAHCGECHNGELLAGSSKFDQSLRGGMIDHWYAPNITSDVRDGIGGWTQSELVQFLKTGSVPGKGVAVGPMAETVHSLAQLSDADLVAIAAYLKSTQPAPSPQRGHEVDVASTNHGGQVYLSYCASCHGLKGEGLPGAVPALAGNGAVMAKGAQNVIMVVLGGLQARQDYAPMLAIGAGMSDAEVADVVNYVRKSWGNDAPATAAADSVRAARGVVDTLMSGERVSGCPAVVPPELARLVASPQARLHARLAAIDEATLAQDVPPLVADVREALPTLPTAQVVNGLAAAYCPVVRGDAGLDANAKALRIGHFSELVYTQLSSNGLPVGRR
jgi:mono/diheme cytochrome c family protein